MDIDRLAILATIETSGYGCFRYSSTYIPQNKVQNILSQFFWPVGTVGKDSGLGKVRYSVVGTVLTPRLGQVSRITSM